MWSTVRAKRSTNIRDRGPVCDLLRLCFVEKFQMDISDGSRIFFGHSIISFSCKTAGLRSSGPPPFHEMCGSSGWFLKPNNLLSLITTLILFISTVSNNDATPLLTTDGSLEVSYGLAVLGRRQDYRQPRGIQAKPLRNIYGLDRVWYISWSLLPFRGYFRSHIGTLLYLIAFTNQTKP